MRSKTFFSPLIRTPESRRGFGCGWTDVGCGLILAAALGLSSPPILHAAGIAYGTVNNFDTVNDDTNECHGFEIELDDIHSTDITYTFDYNHYGIPRITEDSGDGVYTNATPTTVIASPNAGYRFVNWTENGEVVSTAASYTFTNVVSRSLVANFVPAPTLSVLPQPGGFVLTWPTNFAGYSLQQNMSLGTPDWSGAVEAVTTAGTNYQISILATNRARLFRLVR